jgi:glycosyltransferase involved in cell wall biosynthesis
MRGPAVSTIVAAFNEERFLSQAIESALAQDYSPHEVIVIDDGSTDRTAEIAEGFEGVKLLRQDNKGLATARNVGIEASTGELIALLDGDDMSAPGRLESQVTYLLEHPGDAGVLGRHELVIEEGTELPRWVVEMPQLLAKTAGANLSERLPLLPDHPTGSMVARREAFERVGPFDPSFRLCEDVDWILRAWEAGLTFGAVHDVVLLRRIHGNNMTYDEKGGREALLQVLKARIDRRRGAALAE